MLDFICEIFPPEWYPTAMIAVGELSGEFMTDLLSDQISLGHSELTS